MRNQQTKSFPTRVALTVDVKVPPSVEVVSNVADESVGVSSPVDVLSVGWGI